MRRPFVFENVGEIVDQNLILAAWMASNIVPRA